ncbi:TPA: LysR family transcriptional regulator [Escherichia coli]|nr:LysR family transcriptional regulator [Escherichia coli]
MKRKIPRTELLITFETVALYENYSRAAEVLGITQSAVYRQIQALEEFLQIQLFHHCKRRITLNNEGKFYLSLIKDTLDKLESVSASFYSQKNEVRTLTLLVNPSFSTHVLIPKLSDFYKLYPDTVINILSLSSLNVLNDFSFDAVIMREDFAAPFSECNYILKEEIVPVCSSTLLYNTKGKLSVNELLDEFTLLHLYTRKKAWQEWFSLSGIYSPDVNDGPWFNLLSMLLMAVRSNLGVALLPRYIVQKYLDNGELVIPCSIPETCYNSFIITWQKNKESGLLLSFRDWLVEKL